MKNILYIIVVFIVLLSSCLTFATDTYYESEKKETDELRIFQGFYKSNSTPIPIAISYGNNYNYEIDIDLVTRKDNPLINKDYMEEIFIQSIILELPDNNIVLLENIVLDSENIQNIISSQSPKKFQKEKGIKMWLSLFHDWRITINFYNIEILDKTKKISTKISISTKYIDGTTRTHYLETEFIKKTDKKWDIWYPTV